MKWNPNRQELIESAKEVGEIVISNEIKERAAKLRKEEAYRLGVMETKKAVREEANCSPDCVNYTKEQVLEMIGEDKIDADMELKHQDKVCCPWDDMAYGYNQAKQEMRDVLEKPLDS